MGSNTGRPQLHALTGLRFVAALWVVLLHAVNMSKVSGPAWNFLTHGYVAVDIFFVLSGYILALNYLDKTGNFRGTRGAFWMARAARIYPVYLAALILSIGLAIDQLHTTNIFGSHWRFTYSGIMTALLLQSWRPDTATLWNFPAWSVAVEAFFYLAFPVIALRVARIPARRLRLWLAICWCAAMAGPLAGFLLNPKICYDVQRDDFVPVLLMVNPLLRLPEFLFGVILGRMHQHDSIGERWLLPLVVAGLGAVALVCLASPQRVPRVFISNGLFAPIWGITIYALARGKPRLLYRALSAKWIVVLGEASYGIYILQAPLAFYVFHYYPGPFRLMTYLILLLALSLISFWYFETPVRNALRSRRRPAPHPASTVTVASSEALESISR